METTQQLVESLIAAGISQYRIAKETGISQPTISRIARGEHGDSTWRTHTAIKAFADKALKRRAKA